MQRKLPRKIKRIVIKVGSSVIATDKMQPQTAHLSSLVDQICHLQKNGYEVILVSSGAIVLGMGEMELSSRPSEMDALQALAAIGQASLMRKYIELFSENKAKCSQVLLTWDDFDDRARYNNIRQTFNTMLAWGVVPIVNENDTIATDEIKFGDNDKLSAMVASLIGADLLIILSDVEGFYDLRDGKKTLFNEIKEITAELEGVAGGTSNKNMSRGGMIAKLHAIKIATHAQVACVIANGQGEDVLKRIVRGDQVGTLFLEKEEKLIARKHWISFGAKPKGQLIVDDGARDALLKGGRSLLLPGILAWEGEFKKEEVVSICDAHKNEIARGIINYSASDLHKLADKKGKAEAVHYDNLVLTNRA